MLNTLYHIVLHGSRLLATVNWPRAVLL